MHVCVCARACILYGENPFLHIIFRDRRRARGSIWRGDLQDDFTPRVHSTRRHHHHRSNIHERARSEIKTGWKNGIYDAHKCIRTCRTMGAHDNRPENWTFFYIHTIICSRCAATAAAMDILSFFHTHLSLLAAPQCLYLENIKKENHPRTLWHTYCIYVYNLLD